jgi:uncharacterized protein
MGSILKIIVLLFAVWLLSLIVRSSLRRIQRDVEGKNAPRRQSTQVAQQMVPCARCGVHVPRADAVVRDGKEYCSPEHARGP